MCLVSSTSRVDVSSFVSVDLLYLYEFTQITDNNIVIFRESSGLIERKMYVKIFIGTACQ